VEFLVEVADPPEDPHSVYRERVSSRYFLTLEVFYDPVTVAGVRYSLRRSHSGPRQIREGGYISGTIRSATTWQQFWFGTPQPAFRDLASLPCAREAFDRASTPARNTALHSLRPARVQTGSRRTVIHPAANATDARPEAWPGQIDSSRRLRCPRPPGRRAQKSLTGASMRGATCRRVLGHVGRWRMKTSKQGKAQAGPAACARSSG